jgi:hypothetical protein
MNIGRFKKIFIFFSEIAKGKVMNRALAFVHVKTLIENNPWMAEAMDVIEIGSSAASHQRCFPSSWKVMHSNYIPMSGCTYIIDGNKPFLIDDNAVDGVVFFNVLYAITDYINCLEESLRISKSFVFFNIPLVSGIARHPVDMNRFTIDKLLDIFSVLQKRYAFDYTIISVGGSFSSAVTLIDPFLKFRIIRLPVYVTAILFDKLDKIINRSCPQQYIVLLKKK